MKPRFDPVQVGWRLGRGWRPSTGPLWVPWDRTTGVLGPQGSGKTLDLLLPALLGAPGGALVTLTKVEDLLLTITVRSASGRRCVVFDPFGSATAGSPKEREDPDNATPSDRRGQLTQPDLLSQHNRGVS